MNEYRCRSCGFVYDPAQKINAGVYFKDIPDTYVCPACKGSKDNFKKLDEKYSESKKEFAKQRDSYVMKSKEA